MQQRHRHTPLSIITLTVLLFVFAVLGSASTASAQQKTFFTEHYVLGPIRVFYIKEGKDAVPLDDVDRTGVPDRVEGISKQVWAAHHLFCEVLKFPDPFKSERYKGVTCIQISLREVGRGTGLTFTGSQRARPIPEGKPTDRAVVMLINCKLNPIVRGMNLDGLLSNKLLGERLASLSYSDGTPVLRDRTLQGAAIMRDIVIELGKLDDVAFEELKYDNWSEENQRAEENGPYIYKAVMDVFRRRVPSVGPYEVSAVKRPMVQNNTAGDAFRVGSVWKGESKFEDFQLTVLERSGDRFKARFDSKSWVREVSGTASGSSVSWKVKDVRVVKGTAGGDNQGPIVSDDRGIRIDLAWRGSNNQGTFTLRKQE